MLDCQTPSQRKAEAAAERGGQVNLKDPTLRTLTPLTTLGASQIIQQTHSKNPENLKPIHPCTSGTDSPKIKAVSRVWLALKVMQ